MNPQKNAVENAVENAEEPAVENAEEPAEEKVGEAVDDTEEKVSEDDGKAFARSYKQSPLYDQMTDLNKKGLDEMAAEGIDAAVKHMFTDQDTGRKLSYSEMRSRYG